MADVINEFGEIEDDCPHCSPTHGDPRSCSWGVRVADEVDSDGQPTHLRVEKSDGAHVAPADARWLWELIRDAAEARAEVDRLRDEIERVERITEGVDRG